MSAEVSMHGVPLRAEGVTAGYGRDPVIRSISVGVKPGEVISLVGPNWTILPSRITAMKSDSDIASSWSCVTKTLVVPSFR